MADQTELSNLYLQCLKRIQEAELEKVNSDAEYNYLREVCEYYEKQSTDVVGKNAVLNQIIADLDSYTQYLLNIAKQNNIPVVEKMQYFNMLHQQRQQQYQQQQQHHQQQQLQQQQQHH